jgi:hypothetical protein
MGIFPSQGHTTFHLHLKRMTHPTHGHLPYTGAHSIPSPSQRGTTHPSHGLSHRPTHSIYVLEDVSRIFNHQHSLSASEAFCTEPSLSRTYSNFILVVIINTPSQLGRYSPPTQVSHESTRTFSWQAVW